MRKVYAAALYASGRAPEARDEVRRLLREDPSARLDTAQYDPGFAHLFDEIALSLREELDRITAERADARRREEESRLARRALAMRILTSESVVERSPPRALTLLPYGVGQFVNGSAGAGWALLATQLALTVGTVTTTSLYAALLSERDPTVIAGSSRARTLEALYYTSLVGSSVLAVTAIAGVIQAYATWRPERVITRERPLPRALDGVQISLSPWGSGDGGGLAMGGRF